MDLQSRPLRSTQQSIALIYNPCPQSKLKKKLYLIYKTLKTKKAVEIAIEESEEVAMEFINANL
jgi:hypothetical protein